MGDILRTDLRDSEEFTQRDSEQFAQRDSEQFTRFVEHIGYPRIARKLSRKAPDRETDQALKPHPLIG